MEKYAKLLGGVWHFRHLKPNDLLTIVNSGQLKRYRKDSIIFQEENPGSGMFVLFSGKVHLCKHSCDGQVQIISVIEPVIMFNEVTAIDGGTNPFTAIAVKDCLTWNIGYERFESLVKRYPLIAKSQLFMPRPHRGPLPELGEIFFYGDWEGCFLPISPTFPLELRKS